MKKIIFLLLFVLLFQVVIFPLPISAESESFSKEDAKKLVEEGFLRLLKMQSGSDHYAREDFIYYKGYYVIINPEIWNEKYYDGLVLAHDSNDYIDYSRDRYYRVTDWSEDITSEKDLLNYVNDVFCGDLAERIKYAEIYNWETQEYSPLPYWIVRNNEIYYKDIAVGENTWELLSFGNFSITGEDKAVIEITLGKRSGLLDEDEIPGDPYIHEDRRIYVPSKETVEFTKTADSWRISGGSLFYVVLHDRVPSPNTSDSTVPTIAILGTVAVISLALPVVIYKRRRRVA